MHIQCVCLFILLLKAIVQIIHEINLFLHLQKAGKKGIFAHNIVLHADKVTPTDSQLIPTGELLTLIEK